MKNMQQKKVLNQLEEQAVYEGYGYLVNDDLTMDQIAKAKLYTSQQGNKALQIENNLVPKKDIRKIVLKDSISNLSLLENNFNERDARIQAGEQFDIDDHSKY